MKKILNSTLPNNESPDVSTLPEAEQLTIASKAGELVERGMFEPTAAQAKIKAKFWTKFQPGPFTNIETLSVDEAIYITGSTSLKKYWLERGFKEWFLNRDEERERIKYLFNKGLTTMEQILDNPDANANAKANIIKMLAEMNGYLSKKPVEKFSDEEINKMSENQLKAFLEKKGVVITTEKVVNLDSEE